MITRRAFLAGAAAAACGARAPAVVGIGAQRALEREVGQILFCGWIEPSPPSSIRRRIARGSLGGVVLFRRNAPEGARAFARAIRELRDASPPGEAILVAATQEGGAIRPLVPEMTPWPAALRLGERAARSAEDRGRAETLAAAWGRALGEELSALGIDLDFAPVLDVHTNPANPIIAERAFATEALEVVRLAGAHARGLASAGVLACGKHFPGHGDTAVDSHVDLPRVEHDLGRLRGVELAPFRALAGELPLLMTAHVVYPALDPEHPATLSPRIAGELVRVELGYRGVVITDDLEMRAITSRFSIEDAAVAAVHAGCDALLIAHHEERQERAADALRAAASRDPAFRRRIEESAARLRALKERHLSTPRIRPVSDVVGAPAHRRVAAEIADAGAP